MKPTLVLLSGLLNDTALWQYQITALAKDFRIVVPKLTGQETVAGLAQHVLQGAGPQFALAGLSMGGYVALEVMRQAPARVTQLALLDTSARPDTPEQTARRRVSIAAAEGGNFKGVTQRLLPSLISPSRLADETLKQIIMDMAGRVGNQAFIRQQKAILSRPDSRPFLPAIRTPTMIICGEDDTLTPPSYAAEMADAIPNASLHLLPQCGHLATLEQPEAVNALFTWFKH